LHDFLGETFVDRLIQLGDDFGGTPRGANTPYRSSRHSREARPDSIAWARRALPGKRSLPVTASALSWPDLNWPEHGGHRHEHDVDLLAEQSGDCLGEVRNGT